MDNRIKFSIMTPVYNVELYVGECIDSVLAQTYENFELVLIDDGSTDNSGKICDEYKEKDDRIKVYHIPNEGLLHARRYALERVNGEYYVFLDSDDKIYPNTLETIANNIAETNADCIIYGFEKFCDGKIIASVSEPNAQVLTNKESIYNKIFTDSKFNAVWRKAVKATVFHKVDYSRYYHINLAEDLLQSIEIMEYSNSVSFIPDILYRYRLNPLSMTQTIEYKNYKIDYTVREKVLELYSRTEEISGDSLEKYREYCAKIVFNDIKMVCSFDTPQKNKCNMLSQINRTQFYSEFVSKTQLKNLSCRNAVLMLLFKLKLYRLITSIIK